MKNIISLFLIVIIVSLFTCGVSREDSASAGNHTADVSKTLLKNNKSSAPPINKLDSFFTSRMIDSNGLILRHLPANSSDIRLLESMGQYLLYKNKLHDEAGFNTVWKNTEDFFIQDDVLCWMVDANGDVMERVSALVDDLRLIRALDAALTEFGSAEISGNIAQVSRIITKGSIKNNTWRDYYDASNEYASPSLSLFYADIHGMEIVASYVPETTAALGTAREILTNITGQEGVFFPSSYDYASGTYTYPESFNMVEQIYSANNIKYAGGDIQSFVDFLEKQILEKKKIYNYYTVDGKRAGKDESVAVYALSYQLLKSEGKFKAASTAYKKLIKFQIKKGRYTGALSASPREVYAFDQLEAMLALTN